eukprot:TRINITY_DN43627_c0_g1_i1.p1 TRINITY_DN43627_c0_g1~~TRINITY_DN43627_c0_g1_i1.p1  ORF type:complete len:605 (+),score=145.09 TRINITY_DN43627_c0_g1_i1:141-1817(+)
MRPPPIAIASPHLPPVQHPSNPLVAPGSFMSSPAERRETKLLTPGAAWTMAVHDALPHHCAESEGESPQPSPLVVPNKGISRLPSRAAWGPHRVRVSFTGIGPGAQRTMRTSDMPAGYSTAVQQSNSLAHSARLSSIPVTAGDDEGDTFLDPVLDPDVGLVPPGWRDILARTGGSWTECVRHIGFIGHTLWCGLLCTAFGCAVAAWKAWVYASDSGDPDTALEVVDQALSLGAIVAYFVVHCFELPYPSERSPLMRAAAFAFWAVCVGVVAAVGHGGEVVSAASIGSIVAVGVFGAVRLRLFGFFATYCLPFLHLCVYLIPMFRYLLPEMEHASEGKVLMLRLIFAVAPLPPLAALHVALRLRHRLRFPRMIRASFAGPRLCFAFACKLISFALPLWPLLVAEVTHHALRLLLRAASPRLWAAVERLITGEWPTDHESTPWQQVRIHASQSVITGLQSDLAATHAAGWVLFWLRYQHGHALDVLQLLLSGTLQTVVCVFEGIASTALLHHQRVPVSGVYWLFSKTEHAALIVSLTCCVTFAALRGDVLDVVSTLDNTL